MNIMSHIRDNRPRAKGLMSRIRDRFPVSVKGLMPIPKV